MLISLFRVTSWFDTVCNIATHWVNFRDNHLHEHDLQLSNYNIYKYFDPNIMYFWYYLQFFILTLKKFISKKCKYIFFYQKFVHLGENTSKYCSQIIVVHVHAIVFFSKNHPACHNIANGIKPGSDSKN